MGFMKKTLKVTAVAGASYGGFRAFKKYQELKENYKEVYLFKTKAKTYEDEEYEGGSYATMFSVLEMDLSEATIEEDEVTIDVYGLCSVIDIKVPKGWNIEMKGTSSKAVVDNGLASEEPESEEEEIEKIVDEFEEKPTVIINYKLTCAVLSVNEKKDKEELEEEVDVEAEDVEIVEEVSDESIIVEVDDSDEDQTTTVKDSDEVVKEEETE